MLTNLGEQHGASHSSPGAALIGLFCGLAGNPFGERFLRGVREPRYLPISWKVSFFGAWADTFSHLLTGSTANADVMLLSPFVMASPLFGLIRVEVVHRCCRA